MSGIYIYLVCVDVLSKDEVSSLFLEVLLQTAIGHVGHDDVGGSSSVQTHSDQAQNVGVVEELHLQTLVQNLVYLIVVIESCMSIPSVYYFSGEGKQ